MPTVLLSNHPGYPRFAGDPVLPGQIAAMVDALEANGWLADTAAVITGYLPSPAHVTEARSAVERVRRANPGALYLCDPVFGDEPDGLYSLRSHGRRYSRRAAATCQPDDAQWLRAVVARRSARRGSTPRPARPLGHLGCRPCSPPRFRHPTTASPTCWSAATRASPATSPAGRRPHTVPAIFSQRCISAGCSTAMRRPQPSPPPRRPSKPASPPATAGINCRSLLRVLYGRTRAHCRRRLSDAEARGSNGQQDAERGAHQRRQSLLRARGGRRHRVACRRASRPHPAELGRQRALQLAARNACAHRPCTASPSTSRCCIGSTTA